MLSLLFGTSKSSMHNNERTNMYQISANLFDLNGKIKWRKKESIENQTLGNLNVQFGMVSL
jgi:hypothetical protein